MANENDQTIRRTRRGTLPSNSARKIRDAFVIPGRNPAYHEAQKRELRRKWPTLYHAIEDLLKEMSEVERSNDARSSE